MNRTQDGVKITERLLSEIWSCQLLKHDDLLTAEGRKLWVIHPGMRNSDSGPDFLDAVLFIDGIGMLRGDVELHVEARDWRAHGHHRDRNYDGVILHVVMWEGACSPIGFLRSGRRIDILPLHCCLKKPVQEMQVTMQQTAFLARPCASALEILGEETLASVFDEAGERRFIIKAERFETELAIREPREVLYEGFMVALGYTKNKESFREFARRLPLSSVEMLARETNAQGRLLLIQALLLGAAGMLPGQRHMPMSDVWEEALEHSWPQIAGGQGMTINQWRLFRVRPENHPVRRLAGASYLLAKYHEEGFLESMLKFVCQACLQGGWRKLEDSLIVPAQGYWSKHFDFGIPAGSRRSLIGRGRAREIVINVLLPFFFAWARIARTPWLGKHVLEIYEQYPRQEENWITRYMQNQIFCQKRSDVVDSARRQQGLIHLHRKLCAELQCIHCPLCDKTLFEACA